MLARECPPVKCQLELKLNRLIFYKFIPYNYLFAFLSSRLNEVKSKKFFGIKNLKLMIENMKMGIVNKGRVLNESKLNLVIKIIDKLYR